MNKYSTAIFALVGVITSVVVLVIWNGIVFKILWGWFFVPVFQLSPLSIAQAIGIGLVFHYLQGMHRTEEVEWKDRIIKLLYGPMALLIGWIVKAFV